MDEESHFRLLHQAVDDDSIMELETIVVEYSLELCL